MANEMIRYSYGPRALRGGAEAVRWKTKIVSTPALNDYILAGSGDDCDGWIHEVYEPLEAPGTGEPIGTAFTLAAAIRLAKEWYLNAKATAESQGKPLQEDVPPPAPRAAEPDDILDQVIDEDDFVRIEVEE